MRGRSQQQHRSPTASPTNRESGAIRIKLLGGFRVRVGSQVIEEDRWRLRKATSLVKLLALSPGHRLHREQVMDLLWPDLDPKAAEQPPPHPPRRPPRPGTLGRRRFWLPAPSARGRPYRGWTRVGRRRSLRGGGDCGPSRHGAGGLQGGHRALLGRALAPGPLRSMGGGEAGTATRAVHLATPGAGRVYEERLGDRDGHRSVGKGGGPKNLPTKRAHAGLMRLYALSGGEGRR